MTTTDRHREAFREEAAELLAELEVSLLALEQRPQDRDLVGSVFRALHTIKGSGAMFGFDAVAAFTHELETVFDGVREGRVAVSAELVGITLEARDHIARMLNQLSGDAKETLGAGDSLLARLRRAVPLAADSSAEPEQCDLPPAPSGPVRTYRIRFEPAPDMLRCGMDPLLLLREMADLGELHLAANAARIPSLDSLNVDDCYLYWEGTLDTPADENAIRDVFIFVEDQAQLLIEVNGTGPAATEHVAAQPRAKAEAAASLRVPAAKLDGLLNIVGELVTVQARLTDFALHSVDPEIAFIAEELERLSTQLRESTMSIRMLPIGDIFGRFRRLVRDLSHELGKNVDLTTEGNDTELDKTVIEQLNDPLLHLVRNAVDHGIEAPEKRAASRKPAAGRIHLSATHEGAFVTVRITDDGAGLNRSAIRARAVEKGLIPADAVLTDSQLDSLILLPGFSTSERVTEISGRGVGMDVVQRSISAMHGTMSVSSTPGSGTVVTLKIPLTLAIIDGLLVEAAGEFFVFPVSNISECIELIRERTAAKHSLLNRRGEFIPYICLRERFALDSARPAIEQVIIAETHEGKYGFVVDRVIGHHHTVVKKLGAVYRHVEEVSGATILGDGNVALILDVDKLAASAVRESLASYAA